MRDFRRIKAWQRAHALSIAIDKLSRHFRRAGYSKLRAQLVNAAQSIGANIVEGCGATSNKEFARFLGISVDSANETEYHLLTSRDLELLAVDKWRGCNCETIEVRKMIYIYRQRVLADLLDNER